MFGAEGRTRRRSTHIKLEKLESAYVPSEDTCVKAFVRLMAQAARDPESES